VEKFKSRKFLTMLATNVIMLVAAVMVVYLSPEQLDAVEKLAGALAPLVVGGFVAHKYIDTEGKNDALDLARQIEEAKKRRRSPTKKEPQ
jgi:cytosine/uracil/thiamine/allantoin permease